MSDQYSRQTGGTTQRSRRDRVGISISSPDATTLLNAISEAEAADVAQLWMTQNPMSLDALTMYAVAFERTERIRLGTSIVPTYPRHPLALAQQVATVDALGPGRLRLGVGPSHRPVIEGVYGFRMESPLDHLREYVDVLRAALWNGEVDHEGRFFNVHAKLAATPRVPILISALGENAFRLAGAISDGAISWNCPPNYLANVALPALQVGAQDAGRATPPLVAHAWAAVSTDIAAIRVAAKKALATYARLPFYMNMFAAAGYAIQDHEPSDALIDALVISGEPDAISMRLNELLDKGFDELLLTPLAMGDAATERTRLFHVVGQLE